MSAANCRVRGKYAGQIFTQEAGCRPFMPLTPQPLTRRGPLPKGEEKCVILDTNFAHSKNFCDKSAV